ncbi:MAG TPA: DUF4153 domain-containing protein [Bacteroidia bacterium]|nr:DUF4153 domain-containing protein [Bacteroidia bacterium]
MIKLPSVQSAFSQLLATLKRFPLTTLCAFIGTGMLIHLTRREWYDYTDNEEGMFVWAKIAMCAELGLCIFTAAALFCEAKAFKPVQMLFTNLTGLGLIAIYYLTINHYEHFKVENFTRYSLYIVASHLLVAFAPFVGKGHINGFWQYNRALFLRFLLSFLYTVVLYGGICIGMWLLDDLLHVPIHSKYYLYAWFFMVGIFNTIFFLAGVPKNIAELDSDTSYLKGLKVFTQFVLLPLVTMYLAILYLYVLRILIIGSLPKGYVSYLVISFSGMGILSLLLIYPIRNLDDNKWIKTFSRLFYWALYPLIILLAFSIYKRVREYGITADRYFIVVLAIWLACIAAYFLFSKKENIKVIPISLCLIAVFSSFGPWGAFSIAAQSQKRQLEKVMTASSVLVDGKINKDKANVVIDSVRYRVQSVVEYLVNTGEINILQPYVKQNLDSLDYIFANNRYGYAYGETQTIMNFMGFSGYNNYSSANYSTDYDKYPHISFNKKYEGGNSNTNVDVRGYDYYSQYSKYLSTTENIITPDSTANNSWFMAGTDSFTVVPFKQPSKFAIMYRGKVVAVLEMNETLKALQKKYSTSPDNTYVDVPGAELSIVAESSEYSFLFRFSRISAIVKDDNFYVWEMNADLLTKKK